MINLDLIEFAFGLIDGVVSVLLLTFWLTVITYRLKLTLKKHKYYLKEYFGDSRIRSEILYALETVRNKDIFLLILVLLEIVIYFCLVLVIPQMDINVYQHYHSTEEFHQQFSNCSSFNPLIAYSYLHPANAFMIITFGMMIITQFMLISFLNSYLSGRYFGHSLPRKVIYKYIFWWIFQYFTLGILIIPKLLIALPSVTTIFFFLNWLNLIASSRKLSRAIRSKMNEIRLFEWNPTLYRCLSITFKQYKIFMGFLIVAFFFLLLTIMYLSITFMFGIVIFANCFLEKVYGINLNVTLPPSSIQIIAEYFVGVQRGVAILFAFLYSFFLLIPSLFFFLSYVVNLLYYRFTGKGNMSRIKAELFQPLMNYEV